MNYRNQDIDYIQKSVEEGERRERYLQKHIKDKYEIALVKHSNQFKHYDFIFNKNIKLELKTYNYSTDCIREAFLGIDKIDYYHYRMSFNPNLRFFVIFGFYYIKDDKQYIKYLFEEVDIEKIRKYRKIIFKNKKHRCFPIDGLKPLKDLVKIIQQL